jgi:hypothetical protein
VECTTRNRIGYIIF